MADFVAVLKKTLDGLGQTTPATRAKVYDKARAAIAAKLAAMNPPPPAAIADRQKQALEDAIGAVEREYEAASDPLAELENVFASLKNPQPKALPAEPVVHQQEPSWSRASAPPQPHQPAPVAIDDDPELSTTVASPPPDEAQDDRIDFGLQRDQRPRRGYGGLVAAALVLAVLAGGGYGVWLNRDAFSALVGFAGPETPVAPAETPAPAPAEEQAAVEPPAEAAPAATPPPAESTKFTQRLTPEGAEVDPGPASGETGVGEGTSISALTQPPLAPAAPGIDIAPADPAAPADGTAEAAAPATPDAPGSAPAATPGTPADAAAPAQAAAEAAVPVGQRAIFYEERTATSDGSAQPGSIVWSLIQESPGANQPPEAAIRAEASIPGKDIQLRMTIKRNADQTLPASHIIEMIFLTPDGFEGGGIDNILRVAMKGSEQEAGNPLIGIPAKIADGFFLVALNDSRAEIDANMTLMRRQSWIDVPIVYKSGRRALFTMEKGIPGEKVFEDALRAWQAASAG